MFISIIKSTIALIYVIFFLNLSCYAGNTTFLNQNEDAAFNQASDLYSSSNYQKAIEIYKDLISKGIRNEKVYYNLANSYLKTNRITEAILNYKNASVYAPRDLDIMANLEYAKSISSADYFEDKQDSDFERIIFFWYHYLNPVELAIIFLAVNFLSCLLILASYIYESEILTALKFFFIVLASILLISLSIKMYYNFNISEGLVMHNNAAINSGNGNDFKLLFTLKEGDPVKIIEKKGDWYKIADEQNRKGWMNKKTVGLIDAHF